MRRSNRDKREPEFKERVVSINRVTKVVKGGRNFRFSALVVVGDEKGNVGMGMAKALEVPEAIRKAIQDARKNMISVPLVGTTIPHEIMGKFGAGRVLLMPSKEGTGVIAGGAVRAVCELAGIKDIRAKSLGTANPRNVVNATMEGLKGLKRVEEVAKLRGKTVEEILGQGGFGMAMIKIKLVKSPIGRTVAQKKTIKALGFKKIGQVVEKNDTPQIRGMIHQVDYMVEVTD